MQYKVKYGTFGEKAEEYVEAKSEAEAIEKIQSGYNYPLTKIRAKEVYNPTVEDYHQMKEICIFLTCVCLGLVIALMLK